MKVPDKLLHLAERGMFDGLDPKSPTFREDLNKLSGKIQKIETRIKRIVYDTGDAKFISQFNDLFISRYTIVEYLLMQLKKHYKRYALIKSGNFVQVDEKLVCDILSEVSTEDLNDEKAKEKAKLLDARMERIIESGKYPILPTETPEGVIQKLDGVMFILLLILESVVHGSWERELSAEKGGEILNELLKKKGAGDDGDKEKGA